MTNIALVHMDGPQKLNTDGEMIASSCMDSAGIECSKPAPTAELNALAQREVRRNAVINAKLRDRLKTFLHLDTGMRVTAILRAICIGALCIAFSNFLFLLQATPRNYEIWFAISAITLPAFIIMAPLAGLMHYWTRRRRNLASGGFFAQGLRVDEQGRLVTDTAHPGVVVDLGHGTPPYFIPLDDRPTR